LSPAQIASPIREILRKQQNTTVVMGEVVGVDKERKLVFVNSPDRENVPVHYDYLILATGATHSYFGHKEFEPFAPGLKSLADAVTLRNKILETFEQAEAEEDPLAHRDLLTFVLVGGGPTGVEMASALAFLVRNTLRSQFRRINPASARIVLIDMANRVLGPFAEDLSRAAQKRLEKLGVEVRLGHGVDQIDEDGVIVAGERIFTKTVIWTAGVAPSPAGLWLNVETDRAGRVRIQQDLTVPGYPDILAVGDTATLTQDGKPLGGVAQVAIQQGRYAGKLIQRRVAGQAEPSLFRYFDKGTMAVVGPGYAVMQGGGVRLKGFPAWIVWLTVHVMFLAQISLRLSVCLQWAWTFLTGKRGSRLIVSAHGSAPATQTSEPAVGASTAR
jgi:NADH:quinone reductase (non-electrogenic)